MSHFSRTDETTAPARDLRRRTTKAEWKLWALMRSAALGAPFRRQHPIGPFYADFYCASLRLVIELDGSQYAERQEADAARTAFLNDQGIEVLRFWNSDVIENIEGVATMIIETVRRRKIDLGLR